MGKLIVNKKIFRNIFLAILAYIASLFVMWGFMFTGMFFCDFACHCASIPQAYRELNEIQQLYMQCESWSQFKQLLYDKGFFTGQDEDNTNEWGNWSYFFPKVYHPDFVDYSASLFNMPSVPFRYPRFIRVTMDQKKDKIVDIEVIYEEMR